MFQLLGAVFVIFSCTAFAFQSIIKRRAAQNAMEELRDMLISLKQHINFSLEPLPDLILRLDQEGTKENQIFLHALATEIHNNPHHPLGDHWEKTLQCFSAEKNLSQRVTQIMHALGQSLGKLDYASETERMKAACEMLDECIKKDSDTLERSEKTVKSLGVLLGIFIVILFL